ncbi:hypothetical protein MHU86_926 [Fragilaria crotonensis]|nr:hypothetical protein MHU86_926 [Fragilaria crotonensis]
MVPHAPWLRAAPPWPTNPHISTADRDPRTTTATPAAGAQRKRSAEHITDAEATLGKLAHDMGRALKLKGWHRLIDELRGQSDVTPTVRSIPHKAGRLLEHLRRRGASVPMASPPWDLDRKDAAILRGSHQSSHGEREFVAQEMLDFCRQGYWLVVPYRAVRHWPRLRISPLGVVPQRDRCPRLIVDYTFSGVNGETVLLAPREAMQFGRVLQRILTNIVHADPRYGPVHMVKIDIADGFYRVWLQIADIPQLGVALPTTPGCDPLVAFPLALPMGWVESPPYFTSLTETSCDLANNMLARNVDARLFCKHRLEDVAATVPTDTNISPRVATFRAPTHHAGQRRPPLAAVDVYVDDFLLLAQTRPQRQRVLRAALAAIDDVFRPVTPCDPSYRQEPASHKKMLKGDAHWATQKRMLGWDINTEEMTLTFPTPRRAVT